MEYLTNKELAAFCPPTLGRISAIDCKTDTNIQHYSTGEVSKYVTFLELKCVSVLYAASVAPDWSMQPHRLNKSYSVYGSAYILLMFPSRDTVKPESAGHPY